MLAAAGKKGSNLTLAEFFYWYLIGYIMYYALGIVLLIAQLLSFQSSGHITNAPEKKFRHELAVGFREGYIPTGDWRTAPRSGCITPEYCFRYSDRFGVKLSYLGYFLRPLELEYLKEPFYVGRIYGRDYEYWTFLPFYTFKFARRHLVSAGLGYTIRNGREKYVSGVNTVDIVVDYYDVHDRGVIGEIGYNYDFNKFLTVGTDLSYRSFNRGDPILYFGVKLGFVVRH